MFTRKRRFREIYKLEPGERAEFVRQRRGESLRHSRITKTSTSFRPDGVRSFSARVILPFVPRKNRGQNRGVQAAMKHGAIHTNERWRCRGTDFVQCEAAEAMLSAQGEILFAPVPSNSSKAQHTKRAANPMSAPTGTVATTACAATEFDSWQRRKRLLWRVTSVGRILGIEFENIAMPFDPRATALPSCAFSDKNRLPALCRDENKTLRSIARIPGNIGAGEFITRF